jgi:hypothetical protein
VKAPLNFGVSSARPEANHYVGVLRLEGELKGELGQHPCLSEVDMLLADRFDGCNHLTLVGNPASRAMENRQGNTDTVLFDRFVYYRSPVPHCAVASKEETPAFKVLV